MADEVCKSWPRLLGAPNQQSAYQKTISSYFLASCSLEMGYLQRKKFFLLHFLIFKSYFYAYFSHHITGPKFIGGGGVRRGSAKSPSLSYFFFEAFPNLMINSCTQLLHCTLSLPSPCLCLVVTDGRLVCSNQPQPYTQYLLGRGDLSTLQICLHK